MHKEDTFIQYSTYRHHRFVYYDILWDICYSVQNIDYGENTYSWFSNVILQIVCCIAEFFHKSWESSLIQILNGKDNKGLIIVYCWYAHLWTYCIMAPIKSMFTSTLEGENIPYKYQLKDLCVVNNDWGVLPEILLLNLWFRSEYKCFPVVPRSRPLYRWPSWSLLPWACSLL